MPKLIPHSPFWSLQLSPSWRVLERTKPGQHSLHDASCCAREATRGRCPSPQLTAISAACLILQEKQSTQVCSMPDASAVLQIIQVTDYCVTTCLLCVPPALSYISVVTAASPAAITCHHQSHALPSDLAIRQISLNWYCPSSLIIIFIVSFNTTQRLQFPLIRSVEDSSARGVSDPRSDILSEGDSPAGHCVWGPQLRERGLLVLPAR